MMLPVATARKVELSGTVPVLALMFFVAVKFCSAAADAGWFFTPFERSGVNPVLEMSGE